MAATSLSRVVLIACGSFNPITNMHLRMFELARDHLHGTGKYCVVGGIISPVSDAYTRKILAPGAHRCAMVQLALKACPWVVMDTWEYEQNKWLETVPVLRHFRDVLDTNANVASDNVMRRFLLNDSTGLIEPVQLKFLCGADVLESFSIPGLYKDSHLHELVSQFGLVVISRSDWNPTKFIYESDILSQYKHNIDIVTEWIPNEISSTKVRTALRRGHSIKFLLQDSVIEYIHRHRLYDIPTSASLPQPCHTNQNDENDTYDGGDSVWQCFTQSVNSPSEVLVINPYGQFERFDEPRPTSYETSIDNNGVTYKRSKSLDAHRHSVTGHLLAVDRLDVERGAQGRTSREGAAPMPTFRTRSFEAGRGGGSHQPLQGPSTSYPVAPGYHSSQYTGQDVGYSKGHQYVGQIPGQQLGHYMGQGHTNQSRYVGQVDYSASHVGYRRHGAINYDREQEQRNNEAVTQRREMYKRGSLQGSYSIRQYQPGYEEQSYERDLRTGASSVRMSTDAAHAVRGPMRREAQSVRDDHQPIRGDVQPIRRDGQPIRMDVQPVKRDVQPIRSDGQQIRSDAHPIRNDIQPSRGGHRHDRSPSAPYRQPDYPAPPPPPTQRREASADSISDRRRQDYQRNLSADSVESQRMDDVDPAYLAKRHSLSERGRSQVKVKDAQHEGSVVHREGTASRRDTLTDSGNSSFASTVTAQRCPPDSLFGAERLAAMTRKVARVSPTPETCV